MINSNIKDFFPTPFDLTCKLLNLLPKQELYKICEQVRELTKGDEYKIARIIARPYIGKPGNFTRTPKSK